MSRRHKCLIPLQVDHLQEVFFAFGFSVKVISEMKLSPRIYEKKIEPFKRS